MDIMEKNIRDIYEKTLKPQGIELVSFTDGSTAEANPENFSTEITQRTMVLFRKGENEVTETFYSTDSAKIESIMKQVQLEFALKP